MNEQHQKLIIMCLTAANPSRKSFDRYPAFSFAQSGRKEGAHLPCPHCKITIVRRSENESAVSAAAYPSGEKLFSNIQSRTEILSLTRTESPTKKSCFHPCAAGVCRLQYLMEFRQSAGKTMTLPTSPEVRACHSKGNPIRTVCRPYP